MSIAIFKPDEIGDFVMATGAMHLLAREHGEENTTLVVKSQIASLARREFPRASIIALPWQPRRKGRNQAAANIVHCYPAWRQLRALHVDKFVCLRSQRDYLQTLLFAAPAARQRFAPSNLLLRKGRLRRRAAENLFLRIARPRILPYPSEGGEPTAELASHRAVVGAALGRPVDVLEIMPVLSSAPWRGGKGWLLCPLSSRVSKDYDAGRWAAALRAFPARLAPAKLMLAGGPEQAARLRQFADALVGTGFHSPVEILSPCAIEMFPNVIAEADLVLTVDTAAAHFACASGAPAVIVDSGLNPGIYSPYSPNGRQIWLAGDRARLGRSRWQESVPPEMVASAIARALAP